METQRIFKPTDKNKTPEMGQLGGSGVKSLPWAQVMTQGPVIKAHIRLPAQQSLLLPFSLPLPLPLLMLMRTTCSLSLSHVNK